MLCGVKKIFFNEIVQLVSLGSGLMVGASGVQLAGQTSPCFSTNWKALINLEQI